MTKLFLFVVLIGIIISFPSCLGIPEPPEKGADAEKKSPLLNPEMYNCMQNMLYYHSDIDLNDYDSLDIFYFHAIQDYTTEPQMSLSKKLFATKSWLTNDSLRTNHPECIPDFEARVDSINSYLGKHKKDVIGYVFVHTFVTKGDTMSAIIVMDDDCMMGEVIPVKTITDINPDQYKHHLQGEKS